MDPDTGDDVHLDGDGNGVDADAFCAYYIDKHSENNFPLIWRTKRYLSYQKMFLSKKSIFLYA